ncbi:MAG: mucin desulfatase, partial [Clostridia bacterium]|nr:mucin desulfatase [Clostridia bacterium]
TELSKVFMCEEMFEAYTDGFLSTVGEYLTDDELENLPMGAIIITLETGIRFLTDYIDGDIYFRTEYPEHNLDRARNQFKLVSDMESKRGAMDAIVKKCRARRA